MTGIKKFKDYAQYLQRENEEDKLVIDWETCEGKILRRFDEWRMKEKPDNLQIVTWQYIEERYIGMECPAFIYMQIIFWNKDL